LNDEHQASLAKASLEAEALIGDEAKRFLESELGKCVLGIAQQEMSAAVIDFSNADPTDEKVVRHLQNKIQVATWFRQWIIELFNRGEEALGVLANEPKK
jgi:hypothetical protein